MTDLDRLDDFLVQHNGYQHDPKNDRCAAPEIDAAIIHAYPGLRAELVRLREAKANHFEEIAELDLRRAVLQDECERLREENATLRDYLRAVRQDLLTIEDTAASPGVVGLARSAGAFIDKWLEETNADA